MVAQIIEIFSMRANLLMILGMGLVEQFSKMVDTIMVSGNETGEMAQEERSDSTKRRNNGFELKPERIETLIDLTISLFPRFTKEIENFMAFLIGIYNGA